MSQFSPRMVLHRTVAAQRTKDHGKISKGTLKRIWGFAAKRKAMLFLFLGISVVISVIGVITPILAGDVVNAITSGGPVEVIVWLAIAIAALALGEGLIYDMRTTVFDHVQTMPIAFFNRTRTGALVSRLNNDVIGAQRAFSNTLSGVVANIVSLILTVAVMVTISWQVTLFSILLLPVFLIPARLLGGRLASLQREAADYSAAMSTRMTERFSAGGATLVKLFGAPGAESQAFSERAGRVRDIGVKTAMLQTTFVQALTLVSALALALVYGVGGVQAVLGHLNAGEVVTLAMLLTRLYAPLTMLANARMDIMSAVVSFERVFEVLDLDPLIKEKPEAIALGSGPVTVAFNDVRFAYPTAEQVSLASLEDVSVLDQRESSEVLHGIDFTIQAGQTVALVGSSGAGKSTIAALLPRLYDATEGSITLNDVDVRDVSFDSLKHTIGVVTQDGHLFHESIRDNLTIAAPNATDDQLWSALERARLKPVIEALPDGLDTVIGERGYRLSGGERQRLTIARLLLAAPAVVVLDEATSALDSTNEAAVQTALSEAMVGRTALVIAHRLSTIRAADAILVVENGRILEQGSHDELLAQGGRYAELYRTQFADQE